MKTRVYIPSKRLIVALLTEDLVAELEQNRSASGRLFIAWLDRHAGTLDYIGPIATDQVIANVQKRLNLEVDENLNLLGD